MQRSMELSSHEQEYIENKQHSVEQRTCLNRVLQASIIELTQNQISGLTNNQVHKALLRTCLSLRNM